MKTCHCSCSGTYYYIGIVNFCQQRKKTACNQTVNFPNYKLNTEVQMSAKFNVNLLYICCQLLSMFSSTVPAGNRVTIQ